MPTVMFGFRSHMLRDVEHEARLAHRRPGGDDDEVRGLKARRHLVQVDEAGRYSGDELLVRVQFLDRVEASLREIAQRYEPVADLVVGDCEDRVLGLIENRVGFLFCVVGRGEDLVGRKDQVSERGLFLDDLRVVLDVGRTRHTVDERRNVGGPAHFVELARAPELLFERDEIDGITPFDELDHLVEDAAVRIAEKILRIEHLRGEVERVVVQKNGAQHGPLRFEVMRKRAFGGGGVGHGKK